MSRYYNTVQHTGKYTIKYITYFICSFIKIYIYIQERSHIYNTLEYIPFMQAWAGEIEVVQCPIKVMKANWIKSFAT